MEDLAAAAIYMRAKFGLRYRVAAGPIWLMEGDEDPDQLRSICELGGWIKSNSEREKLKLAETSDAVVSCLADGFEDSWVQCNPYALHCPKSPRRFRDT